MPDSPEQSKKCWKWYHPVLLLLIVVVLVVIQQRWLKTNEVPPAPATTIEQTKAPVEGQQATPPPPVTTPKTKTFETRGVRWVWCAVMVLLTAFVVVAGHGITGFWRGAFIDSKNKISLSRFQMTLWTVLIVSAYLTAVMLNINRGQPDPTAIALDATLWMLMGISTTSLVGSPLIESSKKKAANTPDGPPPAEGRTFELLSQQGVDKDKVDVEGQLIVNKRPEDASWGDLFRGEEVSNAAHLDLGKIQMFYFTLITALAYGMAVAEMFRTTPVGIEGFPGLSSGIVALLGISHTGYLANKAVTRNPS
jgi:hypothetical protein